MTPGQIAQLNPGYFNSAAWWLSAAVVVVVLFVIPLAVHEIRERRQERRQADGEAQP